MRWQAPNSLRFASLSKPDLSLQATRHRADHRPSIASAAERSSSILAWAGARMCRSVNRGWSAAGEVLGDLGLMRRCRQALVAAMLAISATCVWGVEAPYLAATARTQTVDGTRVVDIGPGTTLRTGDGVRIEVGSDDRAYVYVFAIGASGSAVLLHPFSRRPEQALVQAESALTIPQGGAYLPLDRHVGREIVVAVSSRTPIRDLDDMLLSAEEIVAEGRGNLVRGLADFGPAAAISFNHAPPGPAGNEPVVASSPRTNEGRVLKETEGAFRTDGEESGVLSRSGSRIGAIFGDAQSAQVPQSKDPFAATSAESQASTRGSDARMALFGDEPAQPAVRTAPNPPSAGILSGFGDLFGGSLRNAGSVKDGESLDTSEAKQEPQVPVTPAEVAIADESGSSAATPVQVTEPREGERTRQSSTGSALVGSDRDGQSESGVGVLAGFVSLFAARDSSQDASTREASEARTKPSQSTPSQNEATSEAQTFAVPTERAESQRSDRTRQAGTKALVEEVREAESEPSATSGGFLSKLFGGSEESERGSTANNTSNPVPTSDEQPAIARAQPQPLPAEAPAEPQAVAPVSAKKTQGVTTNTSTAEESGGFFSRLFSNDDSELPVSQAVTQPSPPVDSQSKSKQAEPATLEVPASVERSASSNDTQSSGNASTSPPLVASESQSTAAGSVLGSEAVLGSSGSVIANLLSPGSRETSSSSASSETLSSPDSEVREVVPSQPTLEPTIQQEPEQSAQSTLSEASVDVESEQEGFFARLFSANEAEPEAVPPESATSEPSSTNPEPAVPVAATSDETPVPSQTAPADETAVADIPAKDEGATTFAGLLGLFSAASGNDSSDNEEVAAASTVAEANTESAPATLNRESVEVADTTPVDVKTPAIKVPASPDEARGEQSSGVGLLERLGLLLTAGGPSGTAGASATTTVNGQAQNPKVQVQQPTPAPSFRVPSLAANEQPKRLPQIGGDASASSSSTTGGGVLGGAGSRISRLLGAEQPKVPVAESTSEGRSQTPSVSSSVPEQATLANTSRPEPIDVRNTTTRAGSREATVTAVPSASVAPTAAMVESEATPTVVNSSASTPQVVTQRRDRAIAISSPSTTAALETQPAISVKSKAELEPLALTSTQVLNSTQAQSQLDPTVDGAIPRALVLIVTPGGVGSGVVVDDQGHVLSNWRTVNGFRRVNVWFKARSSSGADLSSQYTAEVVRANRSSDLALLKLDLVPKGVEPIALSEGEHPERGEVVYLVGHFGTSSWRYAPGRFVNFKDRHSWLTGGRYVHKAAVLRTRMDARPASPGGVMLNGQLEMVGLNAQVAKRSPDVYAVNARSIRTFLVGELAEKPGG